MLVAILLAACGSDDDTTASDTATGDSTSTVETTTTTEAPAEPLRVLVANDDGIGHPGIDLMVRRLAELRDVEVSVVAPSANMSGSSDKTTPGGAPYSPGRTASGIEGTAVDGFPADAIAVALDELDLEPHLVVSGINDAQNVGPFAEISGTVGVARTAIGRGIPAVAVSAGLEYNDPQFDVAADLVVDWVEQHRDALVDGTQPTDVAISFNIPTCPPAEMGELVEVPLATAFPEGADPFASSCDLADPAPDNDYEAIASGYPAMTEVPEELSSTG